MILDCSLAGRLRMRRAALSDLDAWLARCCDIAPGGEIVTLIEIDGESDGDHTVRLTIEGKSRRRTLRVDEYLPRSCWWYMQEGMT